MIAGGSIALSQMPAQSTKSYKIAGITVEGNQFADAQTIISLSGLKVDDVINWPSDNRIKVALKNLWLRHQFSDVEILIDKVTEIGIILIIKVREYPRLSYIIPEGNEKETFEDIKKAVGKSRGDIISPYDEYLIRQKVKKLYDGEGLQFAKISTKFLPTDTASFYILKINIQEGVEFHVESITFRGNKNFSNSDLASAFDDTKTKQWWQIWKSSKFDVTKYKKDKELLDKFFKKNGYIDAEVLKDSIYYDEPNGQVHLFIDVTEGQKYYLRNVKFVGNTVYPEGMLLKRLDFKKGEPYDVERFENNLKHNEDQTDAASLYADNGYLFSRMESETQKLPPDSVDVLVTVNEGDRVNIRKVIIEGNTKTKDKVIRRELFTRPGDYFNRAAIIQSARALGALNFFNPEALKPDVRFTNDKTKVDVVYKVEEKSTDTFNASIGFAGTFSLAEPLKGGSGQVFNFNWEFGQASRLQNFTIGFTEPWLMDEPTTVGFNLYDSKIDYSPIIMRRTGVSINIGRRFRWPDDYFRGDWSIGVQRNNVDSSVQSTYYRPGVNTEITLTQGFSRNSTDNPFFPTVGSKFSITTQFAMGALGIGTVDYFKNQLKYEVSHPLMQIDGVNRLSLYLSTYWGYVAGFKSDTTISPLELFYMGGNGLGGFGVTPLRGYSDQSVGPKSGGRVLAKHVAELRFAIAMNPMPVSLYAFAEAGNVWSSLSVTDPFSLKRSAGIGVQIMMNPIGLLGFNYGYGFDKDDITGQRSGWKFLFQLGQQ
jgi:outer membrane protein insertion porin family